MYYFFKDYSIYGKYFEQAFCKFKEMSEQEDAKAQCYLGICYIYGLGIDINKSLGLDYLFMAAKNFDAEAMCLLAELGTNESFKYNWYKNAADLNSIDGYMGLAYCYSNGIGVGKSETKAFECYRIAAESGNSEAQFMVGSYYEKGIDVDFDIEKAIQWYKKSAESNRLAAYKLGVIYSKGEDVDPNKNLSEHYFNIALMNDENGEGVKQGSKKLLSKEVANCSNLHKTLIVNELYDKLQRIAAKKEENERQKEENERQNLIKQRKREEQAKHAELVRKYGTSNAVSIEQGKIRLGFTKQMVEEAWGSPWDVTTIINNNGKFECWIFDVGSYVYFINGVVVQIIN